MIPENTIDTIGQKCSESCSDATSLDSFRISGTLPWQKEQKWHPREMREVLYFQAGLRISATGVDALGDVAKFNISALSRWTERGKKRTEARVYKFIDYITEEGYDTSRLHFVTLTVRHIGRYNKGFRSYASMKHTIEKLREGWGKLRLTLKKEGVEYLWVIEPGEKHGYPHLHIILAGASTALCKRLIRLWCDKYNLGLRAGQDWKEVENIKKAGAYLRKYLLKIFDGGWDEDKLRWAELVYREKVRTFGMSKKASAWINKHYKNPVRGLFLVGEMEMDDGKQREQAPVEFRVAQCEAALKRWENMQKVW